jgi:L-asparaginase
MKLLVVNVGGTFNKRYREVQGDLVVPRDDGAVEAVLAAFRGNVDACVRGVVHKDSLEMDCGDREAVAAVIHAHPGVPALVVHGTDTLHMTAEHLARTCPGRRIVLTGSMVPYAFDPREACTNFGMSWGFLLAAQTPGVFVGMHGLVLPHGAIRKDRARGVFVHA